MVRWISLTIWSRIHSKSALQCWRASSRPSRSILSCCGGNFFPDRVVACAAVVAATLPGGDVFAERLRYLYDEDLLEDIPLHAPAPGLAGDALTALLVVASQDGPWHQGWRNESDAAEARKTTDTLVRVLDEAAR